MTLGKWQKERQQPTAPERLTDAYFVRSVSWLLLLLRCGASFLSRSFDVRSGCDRVLLWKLLGSLGDWLTRFTDGIVLELAYYEAYSLYSYNLLNKWSPSSNSNISVVASDSDIMIGLVASKFQDLRIRCKILPLTKAGFVTNEGEPMHCKQYAITLVKQMNTDFKMSR